MPRPGTFRIISGKWRGRRFPIASRPQLRPTTDRARETLFNWLQPVIHGARCLDAYAGTGALGLEALSRGAASVTFIESDASLAQAVTECLDHLAAGDQAKVIRADCWQANLAGVYDIVFLDPPFACTNWQTIMTRLLSASFVDAHTLVYIESPVELNLVEMQRHAWTAVSYSTLGGVAIGVFRRSAGAR